MHRDAVTAAGAELVRFAKSCGLIRGEWIAVDGSKFRVVASIDSVRERLALQRYLDSMEKTDEQIDCADCGGCFRFRVQTTPRRAIRQECIDENDVMLCQLRAPSYDRSRQGPCRAR